MTTASTPLTPSQRAYRTRQNAKRKINRAKLKARLAMPPVVALSKPAYFGLLGTLDTYDAYADAFIAGAKKLNRRYEFPLSTS